MPKRKSHREKPKSVFCETAAAGKHICLSRSKVFFDFDNTITSFDVLDDIIKRFSMNEEWVVIEEKWREGKIGSRECLKGQMNLVRITKPNLLTYLSKIEVDAYFPKLLKLLKRRQVPIAIVSDSFSFIINYILDKNGIDGIDVYSNRLTFDRDKFRVMFPHANKQCFKCANCKRAHIFNHGRSEKFTIYIGDGFSDICPATHADLVFAKGNLLDHFKRIDRVHVPFEHLGTVYNYLKSMDS
ncbi:MAG: MtnX-like HAD-IB family phosphatase [Candidatus Omnitrophota bacterium]